ncbi:MAG: undecaprenyl-diphosphate phosphatase [Deltaproteobacteria bacterium]|nr:undecaprenyl-diphosphate phosphatase [Deltaproteobacteria bacterium]
MDLLIAALLGIVQGISEFLPISSDGHLVISETLLGVGEEGGLSFVIAVHLGSLVALLVFYRARVVGLVRGFFLRDTDALAHIAKLALGTLPAVIVGLTLKDRVEEAFRTPWLAGAGLLLTGTFLITTKRTQPRASALAPTYLQALAIGCAQALAILPGVSRSGSTIALSLALGIAPLAAAEFSFLLGIIAIVGAAVLDLPDLLAAGATAAAAPMLLGAAAAALSGLAALALFVRLLASQRFHAFAYYCWAVGAAFLAYCLAP